MKSRRCFKIDRKWIFILNWSLLYNITWFIYTREESGTTGSILEDSKRETRSFFDWGVDDTEISNLIFCDFLLCFIVAMI